MPSARLLPALALLALGVWLWVYPKPEPSRVHIIFLATFMPTDAQIGNLPHWLEDQTK